MLDDDKNLKDTIPTNSSKLSGTDEEDSMKDSKRKSLTSYEANALNINISLPYTKTNKLITALYIVTDTIDKEEPIRLKLRTLGTEILLDMSSLNLSKATPSNGHINQKITTILSYLNIASNIKMVSEMNCNILIKEFTELNESIQEFTTQNNLWFEEFIFHKSEEELSKETLNKNEINSSIGHIQSMSERKGKLFSSKGHGISIGVQKGSTLLKALNGLERRNNFEIIKERRRKTIIKVIKAYSSSGIDKPNGVGIKDIVIAVHNLGEKTGEKTLQRELVSMVKDNVLKKTGEKRWSKYFLVS